MQLKFVPLPMPHLSFHERHVSCEYDCACPGENLVSDPHSSLLPFIGRADRVSLSRSVLVLAQRRRPVEDDVELDDGDFGGDGEACLSVHLVVI